MNPHRFGRLLTIPFATVACLAVLGGVRETAHAGATKCRAAIAQGASTFVAKKATALQRCLDGVVQGEIVGTCPDAKAAETISKASGTLARGIAKACGGKDKICGSGSVRDEALASIGWNVGSCANVGNGICSNAIQDCDDIASCVGCVSEHAVDQAFDLYYDAIAPNPGGDKVLRRCQREIGKANAILLRAMSRVLARCWLNVNRADSGGSFSCPDTAASVKTAKAKAKSIGRICKACGGPNKQCGGGDDLARISVGFPATCPAVGACGGSVETVQDIGSCVACVTGVLIDNAARSAIPAFSSSSPPPCVAEPTPSVTSTPGG